MSSKSYKLAGHVSLTTIEAFDETAVRALYASNNTPTLEDLRSVLAATASHSPCALDGQIDVDVSSMHTISRDLHATLPLWVDRVEGVTDGLNGLLLSAKAGGIWLWLAYKLLLESVSSGAVTMSLVAPGEGSSATQITSVSLDQVSAGSMETWLWGIDSPKAARRWYRHRVAGPLTVYHRRESLAHDAVNVLNHVMANSPISTGEIYEQVVSRPDIVLTGALVEVNRRIGLPPGATERIDAGDGSTSSRAAGAQILQAALIHDLSTGADPKTLFL